MKPTARWLTTCLCLAAPIAGAQPQTTERVSISSNGTAAQGAPESPNGSGHESISSSGRYVAFSSEDPMLDTFSASAAMSDVYIRDRFAGVTQLISQSNGSPQPPNARSEAPSISADGCSVAFTTTLTGLLGVNNAADTNGVSDVVVRSVTPNFPQGAFDVCPTGGINGYVNAFSQGISTFLPGGWSTQPCISGDGRFVAFRNQNDTTPPISNLPLPAGSILGGPTNIWLRDLTTSTPTFFLCSDLALAGQPPQFSGDSSNPVVSFDGRYVAFETAAPVFVTDPHLGWDICRFDRVAGSSLAISTILTPSLQGTDYYNASISDDGQIIAFDDSFDVFVAQVQGASVSVVRITDSVSGIGGSNPSISPDGEYVAYMASSGELLVHKLSTAVVVRADVGSYGELGNGQASIWRRSLSWGATVTAFSTTATNLVASDTNGVADVLARSPGTPFTSYCFGDGSGAACPCGDAPIAGFGGCPHSHASSGARLRGLGLASITQDQVQLVADSLPSVSSCLFFVATTTYGSLPGGGLGNGGVGGSPFGDGLRCVGGTVDRIPEQTAIAGVCSTGYQAQVQQAVSSFGSTVAGDTRHYQVWFRNAADFCTASTFNLTNAVSVTWLP
jgi:Tol biopolymer transport system component